MKKCPRCQRLSPAEAILCECGHDFVTALGPRQTETGGHLTSTAVKAAAFGLALVIAAAMGWLGALWIPLPVSKVVLASVITWVLLIPILSRLNGSGTLLLGVASTFIGALVLAIEEQEVVTSQNGGPGAVAGMMIYAFSLILIRPWSILWGATTALLLRWILWKGKVFGAERLSW